MALLPILTLPDPRLRIKAKPVEQFDADLRRLVDDMFETMYKSNGVGLAATQINVQQRIFVMDVSDTRDQRICVINPEIISREGKQYENEGCLSVGGGAYDRVERAYKVRLRAQDIEGKPFELDATELMATCIQHEIDHLDGILFIDRLSKLKQERIRKKIEKSQKLENRE